MAIALIIGLWVAYQYSYDRFLPDYERVYKADLKFTNNNGETGVIDITPLPLGNALKKDVPGIEYMAQTSSGSHSLMLGDKKLYLPGLMAGADFLKIFKYPLLRGTAGNLMANPHSVVLTASTAIALFGTDDAVGKVIRIDNKNNLTITGVLKDLPANATIQFNYLIPFEYLIQTDANIKRAVADWGHVTFRTYVALAPDVSYHRLEPELKKIYARYNPADYKTNKGEALLQPLKDWHLLSDYKDGRFSGGFIEYVNIFGVIGILVLLIACINFMNLATARSEKRAREIGVRKVLGSDRKDVVFQFLVESVLITSCAALVSLAITLLALPAFNTLAQAAISIPFTSLSFWVVMVVYVLVTGLLAGSRPAFYLSSFRPVKVLKGRMNNGKASTLPRKALVVIQFTCSIALITGTVIIYQQIQHAKQRDVGYRSQRLVMTDFNKDLNQQYAALKNDLLKSGVVSSVTKSSSPVTAIWSEGGVFDWPGKLPGESVQTVNIGVSDADYFKTMGMQMLIEGTGFTGNPAVDSGKVILNEAAVVSMKLKSPIGQVISWNETSRLQIAGVVKNALMASPFSSPRPTMFIYDPNWSNIVTYKLADGVNTSGALAKIGVIFNRYDPSSPFLYKFVDETYNKKFGLELLIGKLSGLFAAFAILISCLGLFGLAAYTAEQRNKEIGIRKVLGASITQLWMLLTKDFISLVVISSLLASPLAFYPLQDWLQKYEYRITINPIIFAGAGITAIIMTIAIISFQAIKAALVNPVKSLKAE